MNKEEAVKAIESKFDSMTSEQRTTLWKALFELSESEFERGKNYVKPKEKPVVLTTFENEIKSHSIVDLAVKYGIPIETAQNYADGIMRGHFGYWFYQAELSIYKLREEDPNRAEKFVLEVWTYINDKIASRVKNPKKDAPVKKWQHPYYSKKHTKTNSRVRWEEKLFLQFIDEKGIVDYLVNGEDF